MEELVKQLLNKFECDAVVVRPDSETKMYECIPVNFDSKKNIFTEVSQENK